MSRYVELLAPARNAEVGREAFNHGADAVYIGAPAFSARAAAGNTVEDIADLARYGHQFGARTIVAFNTILTDVELPEAERLTWQLYEAGVDALIVQDLGLLQLNLPPIELHASTQTDNRTIAKTRLMRDLGMTRVVMARELSISQIRAIHEAVPEVELECFVHGALCVCVSGQCYLSAAMTGRSANRGECAQPCRLPMDLLKGMGRDEVMLARQRHLLSLRDMNRSAYVAQLIEAGVTSLKIEGRLKDVSYVKNVVAYYRRIIDQVLESQSGAGEAIRPLSLGRCLYTFEPKLEKSFNRGFTSCFAEDKREPMWNFESPKSLGERVGTVGRVGRDSFTIRLDDPSIQLHNGDGLAVGAQGFRLNRYEADTCTCHLLEGTRWCRQLQPGQVVWRNLDTAFEQLLSRPSSRRLLPVEMSFKATAKALSLRMALCERPEVEAQVKMEGSYELAQKPQQENIERQLRKLGDTVFVAEKVEIEGSAWFIPSGQLASLRRQACESLMEAWLKVQTAHRTAFVAPPYVQLASQVDGKGVLPTNYLANVLNEKARQTYAQMGIEDVGKAFEQQKDNEGMVMQTRHCLKYAFGQCTRFANPQPEQLLHPEVKLGNEAVLQIGHKKFILKFGCNDACMSKLFTIFAPEL